MRAITLQSLPFIAVLFISGCALWPFSSSKPFIGPYKDIPIPQEMKIDQDSLNVYDTSDGRLGFVKGEGRIQSAAIIYYYREAMTQNGWQLDSEFDNDKNHMMIFRKQNRSAIITIIEGWVFTKLEINVNKNKHK